MHLPVSLTEPVLAVCRLHFFMSMSMSMSIMPSSSDKCY